MRHATITGVTFIGDADSSFSARPRGRPLHTMPAWFSVAYFAGALVTDLVYWQIPDVMWERFSIWLITAGLILAGLTAITYVIDLVSGRRIGRPAWPPLVGYALAVLLSLLNAFVHSRDAYTAVVPTGLMLSGLVIVVLLLTSWVGTTLTDRSRVGG
jgi:uncharacterized membrane protein